jgi:hypothetical protein
MKPAGGPAPNQEGTMPDEPETPAAPDTLATPPADTDWQARYQSLQPEYTRATQALKDHESLWEDEQTALARLAEKFPHLFEDESEEEPETPEPDQPQQDPRIDWLAERETRRQLDEDLAAAVGDREVIGKQAKDWIEARSRAIALAANKPWNKTTLKQAVDEYFEFVDDVRGPQRKPAPTPPQPGKAGERKYDPRNREERRARMAAALTAQQQ